MAWKIAQKLVASPEFYRVKVRKSTAGTTIVDAGINALGSLQAGKKLTEICMGGAGKVQLGQRSYGEKAFHTINVSTDYPAIATMGSQFAGWRIKDGAHTAYISGPIRALALKPKAIFEEIGYRDQSDRAVLTLESSSLPSDALIEEVTVASNVKPENLIVVGAATASIAGLTQVTGRVVEVGIHRLRTLGLSPMVIRQASGYAPIPPLVKDFEKAMARANDAIHYGGTVYCTVDYEDEARLRVITEQVPFAASKDYGKPFLQIIHEAGGDFYKIDQRFFAPSTIIVTNAKTGNSFKAGEINSKVLAESFGF
jgi:methenyltetrahydromethanopterin cyclohydrolase